MSKVKMNQPVRWSDGTIATPREMLDQGRAVVNVVERLYSPRSAKGYRKATFVDAIEFDGCVEVSSYVATVDAS